ncbi:MAG: anthranilate synthase component I family protein [Bacteroidetes bacterium]|nr:anthranilate synthase component I family protein [Bacteroidota bacterium]
MITDIQTQHRLKIRIRKRMADTLTPVACFLRLRDRYRQAALLESNDFRSAENCFSYIGLDPIAGFRIAGNQMELKFPNGERQEEMLFDLQSVPAKIRTFLGSFKPSEEVPQGVFNGFFGHSSFESFQYFDTLQYEEPEGREVPDMHYTLFRFILAFDHFREEVYLLENAPEGEESQLDQLEALLRQPEPAAYPFQLTQPESSTIRDADFLEMVKAGQRHCQRGDVFQVVLSRRFSQAFRGDDFQVYRQLRSLNPSPYLFYFNFGSYRIFGSSPEAQLQVQDGIASVNPIAGTYKRSGHDEEDRRRAEALAADPKENAEHIMLVDLARNDLGRGTESVEVVKLREVQYFSHVIHLVSRVEGRIPETGSGIEVFANTFPAGTLSGAPKYRAMELIRDYEKGPRGFYGGAIGLMDFKGNMNQAIVIRSVLSRDQVLHYQAGAGIVAASVPESELQEVENKLGAVRTAIKRTIN